MPLNTLTTERFKAFMPFILKEECDYPNRKDGEPSDDPDDPGGYTRWGIDQRSHPKIDVKNLTYEGAIEIYWSEWLENAIEHFDAKMGEVFFNACVNCGPGRAKKLAEISDSAVAFLSNQENFYRRLAAARPSSQKFLSDWLGRTRRLKLFLKL